MPTAREIGGEPSLRQKTKKGSVAKLWFCNRPVGWVNPSASSVRTLYPSPRPKRARLSHAVAPPLPTEPACAGLRRGPDFSPCHLPLHKGGFWPGACSDVVLSGEILPISSLKSDNRNTAVPRPPCVKGAVTVGDWGIVSGGELGNLRILQQTPARFIRIHTQTEKERSR